MEVTRNHPGLARGDRQTRQRFVEMAMALGVEEETTDAFVHAYRGCAPAERRRLADAVMADLARAGWDASRALASLISAEDDPSLVAHLWRALTCRAAPPRAFAASAGDEAQGGLALALPEGPGHAVLWVFWSGLSPATIEMNQAASEADVLRRLARQGGPGRRADLDHAIDDMAQRLWDHVRRGATLPAGVERFASLFSP